ncbi:DsbA family protein [Pediococcus cellicola]|nr:DsbA family protein [Pediococcus cellicola]GEL15744.1 DsbA family protein [Pediococcus cellicola]
MLDVYLFVAPLGKPCMRSEKVMMEFVHNVDQKVSFQIIPMLNMQLVQDYLHSNDNQSYENYNALAEDMYHLILDYKAALFQCKRDGRTFLKLMQTELNQKGIVYSQSLGSEIARQAHLDLEMFEVDRRSQLAKDSFKADQQTALEMNVTSSPSAVIFDDQADECGILVENFSDDVLQQICQDTDCPLSSSISFTHPTISFPHVL